MTLTSRLTAFFVATLAIVLLAFSITLYLITQSQLFRELDARTDACRNVLAASIEVEPNGLEWDPKADEVVNIPTKTLQWAAFDEKGYVTGSSEASGLLASLNPESFGEIASAINLNNQPWRIVSKTVRHPKPEVVVDTTDPAQKRYRRLIFLAAVPVTPVHETLQSLAWQLLAVSSATLLAVTFIARWVCRRALLPLRRMADATQAIRTEDLSARLPMPDAKDELHKLGSAFNDLLSRVHEAMERQKHFTSEASHQLRTPLTAMLGQMEIVLRRNREADDYKQTLHLVKDQASRLNEMIEMLLFLARADADARLPHLDVIELGNWLSRYVNEVWSNHRRFADLQLQIPANTQLHVSVHPDLFAQAIGNLIDNAFKYSEPGSPVQLSLVAEGTEAVVYIEDRGPGIDPKDIPHLFSPFFRSDRARQHGIPGVGLGLAVADRIIRAFRGHIAFDNNTERGGTFSISLPMFMDL